MRPLRRLILLPWSIWFAVIVGIILLVRCVSPAAQERSKETFSVHMQDGSYVRIKDEPCPGAPDWLDLRLAEMHYKGKDYQACWITVGRYVIVLDSSGDKTPIPIGSFTKDVRI